MRTGPDPSGDLWKTFPRFSASGESAILRVPDDGVQMTIPTEPIGSIPRPPQLIEAVARKGSDDPGLEPLYEQAVRDTVQRFEATGSPVTTTGSACLAPVRRRPRALQAGGPVGSQGARGRRSGRRTGPARADPRDVRRRAPHREHGRRGDRGRGGRAAGRAGERHRHARRGRLRAAQEGASAGSGPRGGLPAIALTAFARSEDRTRALQSGFLAHVAKPVEASELVTTVASVVGRTGDLVVE
jgi:hypothetical protein